jgi:hypothetical protein
MALLCNKNKNVYISVEGDALKHSSPINSQSQWPRGIRHEMTSLARTVELWDRIPLKAWMFVCVCV